MKINYGIIFTLFIIACACNVDIQTFDIDEYEVSKELKANPRNYLLTVNDLIYDSVYKSRNYKELESLKIESDSTLPLKMVYRFKVRDTVNNLSMTVGSIINVDNTDEEAKYSLKLYQSGFESGLNAKGKGFEVVNLDSLTSYGDYSKFIGYRKEGEIIVYYFIARYDKLVVLNSFHSNHSHFNYPDFLKKKLEKINAVVSE